MGRTAWFALVYVLPALAVSLVCPVRANASECFGDGDPATMQGSASSLSFTPLDGNTHNVWVFTLDQPICVVEQPYESVEPRQRIVSKVQLHGQPPPIGVELELTGTISTGHDPDYYAQPTVLAVTSSRKIDVPAPQTSEAAPPTIAANPTPPPVAQDDGQKDNPPNAADPSESSSMAFLIALLILGALIYFAPTVVAVSRRHNNVAALFALNLFLGWTLLGWVAALVWALMK